MCDSRIRMKPDWHDRTLPQRTRSTSAGSIAGTAELHRKTRAESWDTSPRCTLLQSLETTVTTGVGGDRRGSCFVARAATTSTLLLSNPVGLEEESRGNVGELVTRLGLRG
jgi:hypothetical protein